MNKHLITLGIAILLICVGLSGCLDGESKFVGTWSYGAAKDTRTFYSDGKYVVSDYDGTWELKDEKLHVIFSMPMLGEISKTYNYAFSNNDNTLTLTEIKSGETRVFSRQ